MLVYVQVFNFLFKKTVFSTYYRFASYSFLKHMSGPASNTYFHTFAVNMAFTLHPEPKMLRDLEKQSLYIRPV